jgi:hypothetical protein
MCDKVKGAMLFMFFLTFVVCQAAYSAHAAEGSSNPSADSRAVSGDVQLLPNERASRLELTIDKSGASKSFQIKLPSRSKIDFAAMLPPGWRQNNRNSRIELDIIDEKDGHCGYQLISVHDQYSVLLEEGTYRLKVSWSKQQESVPLILTVAHPVPVPLPDALRGLSQWFQTTGLNWKLDIRQIYVKEDGSQFPIPEERRNQFDRVFAFVSGCRQLADGFLSATEEMQMDLNGLMEAAEDGVELESDIPKWIDLRGGPNVILLLHSRVDREQIRSLEREAKARWGVSLWNRVLRKVALTSNIPARNVVILAVVPCSGGIVCECVPGVVERHGAECMSASFATALPKSVFERSAAGASDPFKQSINLGQQCEEFLKTFLPQGQAEIQYQERSKGYVEVIVRGLRGHVIKGGRDWEKIQIQFMIGAGDDGSQNLRAFVDGQLSSGIGAYPPDSKFTTSMEPKEAGSLTSYAKELVDAFKMYLSEGAGG